MPNCPTIGSNTNATSLAVAKTGLDSTASTVWYNQQPNDISSFAAALDRVARNPISVDRQRRKGAVTNLTASPAFPMDATVDSVAFWAPVAHFTNWKGPVGGEFGYEVSSITTSGYNIGNAGAALDSRTLLIARNFLTPANNGLKMVGASSTTTRISVSSLATESNIPTAASLHECGYRFAAGDLVIDSNGDLVASSKDLTELPLNVGQYIYIGGSDAVNRFDNADNSGLCRIRSIESGRITVDNTRVDLVTDTGVGKQIDLYYGLWLRNVPMDHADFNVNNITIEASYVLPEGVVYEYATCAVLNTLAIASPLTDKATMDFASVARDITEPTATRRAGVFRDFVANEAFNTSDDIARLRILGADNLGVTTFFTDATVSINNNASPKNVLGVLGAADINFGNIEIGETMTTLFTSPRVTQALRNNETVSFELALVNSDGMVLIDQPEITLGGGDKAFPVNDKVEISLENEAFGSALGYTQSISLFRFNPEA